MTLISSDEAEDFMKDQKTFDKNESKILDWTDGKYYSDTKFVTNSHLGKLIEGGPQHLKMYYEKGGSEDTDAMIFGIAAHCLLLEPEAFDGRFYAIDDTEKCLEIGGKRPRTTNKYKEWLEPIISENAHRQLLSLDDIQTIKDMIDRAMSYKQVREMVESANIRERVYQSELEGVGCKIKVDAINTSNFILDYKTMRDPAIIQNAQKTLRQRRYGRQGAFYKDVAKVDTFWFLFQEKTYPYTVSLAQLSQGSYEEGQEQYKNALGIYKHHFINNYDKIDDFLEVGMV
jgi:hypothetical protein